MTQALPDLTVEVNRTRPDYVAYRPDSIEASDATTGNEHFLVTRLDSERLFAIWTQSSYEAEPDQHVVFATSEDDGVTWSEPRTLAGPDASRGVGMASWGFPLVSASGRLYVLYFRHLGIDDIFTHTTGQLAGIHSDDGGLTWSDESLIPMPPSIWGNPDPAVPSNCIIWQKPLRQSQGKYIVGVTRWVSPKAALRPELAGVRSVVEFIRFENVDSDPAVADLQISWNAGDTAALHLPGGDVQEPTITVLPDGRLFAVMRTSAGSPYWSVSADDGSTWSEVRPLLWRDGSTPIPHPLSPCPQFQVDEGTVALFFHNHDGHFLSYKPSDFEPHRRPICLSRGDFVEGADQPVWYSEPWYFMDTGGVVLRRQGLSLYSSVTANPDGITLWYPDRKFFLLGRDIAHAEIDALPAYGSNA